MKRGNERAPANVGGATIQGRAESASLRNAVSGREKSIPRGKWWGAPPETEADVGTEEEVAPSRAEKGSAMVSEIPRLEHNNQGPVGKQKAH